MRNLRERLVSLKSTRPNRATRTAASPDPVELGRVLSGRIVPTRSGECFLSSSEEALSLETVSRAGVGLLAGTSALSGIPQDRWVFLDTETTGLAGGTGTYAFLVGIAQRMNNNLRIDQYFMRGYDDERSLLEAVGERLAEAQLIVTFNGKAFDLPLLETRFRLARLAPPIQHLAHLDLLYPARQLWHARLGTVRLAELERQVLCRKREGDIPSELIPQIYFDYLRRGDPVPLAEVFRHNRYDVCALVALLARLADVVHATIETAPAEPLDLFGLSRLLERRGLVDRAREFYERTLELGLPAEQEPAALRRLAALSKRLRDYRRAADLWQRWAECDLHSMQPEIELAIFHEHRTRNYPAALAATRRALAKLRRVTALAAMDRDSLFRHRKRLEHRLARLERKQAHLPELSPENNS